MTKDEENILHQCLKALQFVDDIIVFDSYSTDATLQIASEHNTNVYQREFDNYANQRNAALDAVAKSCEWILMVDADEIITEELREEILTEIKIAGKNTMYRVRRKDFFQGKWLRYSSGYPTWFPRLFRNGHVEVVREINEEYLTSGKIGHLKEHMLHYPFNKGISWWFDKHNRYSQMEAKLMLEETQERLKLGELFSKDPVVRRKQLKRLSYRLPFRAHLIFFAFYVLKGGFLDGKPGYQFCRMRHMYEQMIGLKYKELKAFTKS